MLHPVRAPVPGQGMTQLVGVAGTSRAHNGSWFFRRPFGSGKLRAVSKDDHILPEGLYESVVTQTLQRTLGLLTSLDPDVGKVDEADLPHVLTQHVASAVEQVLLSARGTDKRLAIVNGLLEHLGCIEENVPAPASQLLRLTRPSGPGTASMTDIRP